MRGFRDFQQDFYQRANSIKGFSIVAKFNNEILLRNLDLILTKFIPYAIENKIIVMDHGEIKEIGNHESLLQEENGLYKSLVEMQFAH